MILLGVSGGIAAYKTCELVRLLVRAGRDVQVVMTPDAERFVGPTTFAALSRRPVLTESSADVFPHLEASREAELFCIAPAGANTLARIARGEAPNILTQSVLAFGGPLLLAPAMNPRMWDSAATQENVALLETRGVELIGPAAGEMAEGEHGRGRMAEPDQIAARIEQRLATMSSLAGRRMVVTAGGTREPLDAVRYLGNRSSGRMGVAVADEAARRGAAVTLLLAAAVASPSAPMRTVRVETAAELRAATLREAETADIVVMAAAVADYRPAAPAEGKRRKDGDAWLVELEPTADILAELGAARRPGTTLVGFAAEHGDGAVERAREKLRRKGADMIVVNDISRSDIGFDSELNEVVLVTSNEETLISRRSKQACAAAILDWVANQPARAAVERTTV
ncbi:MAG TPA: bifunctional phosphopantothenoylcysteine decarboxylase/phosphopantothenate--cysteine ligase CoaBC [Gaiellales bacterium]|jgi:phosphopantothenoylcysteine decarboxylase/phosphopantothenate--cysteine ligase|nr:bifunctional phosphopantothenoylcysteine decarboxylase/phosphopantothenate--cysteine ligase CoaBC [Gaiellales bacterium]